VRSCACAHVLPASLAGHRRDLERRRSVRALACEFASFIASHEAAP
jgi:hypothetical protein